MIGGVETTTQEPSRGQVPFSLSHRQEFENFGQFPIACACSAASFSALLQVSLLFCENTCLCSTFTMLLQKNASVLSSRR